MVKPQLSPGSVLCTVPGFLRQTHAEHSRNEDFPAAVGFAVDRGHYLRSQGPAKHRFHANPPSDFRVCIHLGDGLTFGTLGKLDLLERTTTDVADAPASGQIHRPRVRLQCVKPHLWMNRVDRFRRGQRLTCHSLCPLCIRLGTAIAARCLWGSAFRSPGIGR